MAKERYRIEIVDTQDKTRKVYLTNNFTQTEKYLLSPVHLKAGEPPQLIRTGYEHVEISIPFPILKKIVPIKKKRKVVRKRKKRRIRKH